jgi:hypothetical protein
MVQRKNDIPVFGLNNPHPLLRKTEDNFLKSKKNSFSLPAQISTRNPHL